MRSRKPAGREPASARSLVLLLGLPGLAALGTVARAAARFGARRAWLD